MQIIPFQLMMGILLELMRMNDPVQPVIRELLEMLIRLAPSTYVDL